MLPAYPSRLSLYWRLTGLLLGLRLLLFGVGDNRTWTSQASIGGGFDSSFRRYRVVPTGRPSARHLSHGFGRTRSELWRVHAEQPHSQMEH